MFIIKTQRGMLLNMAHIESIDIKDNKLMAFTPSNDNGDYDEYSLYEDDNKENLEKVLDFLFEVLTNNIKGIDFFELGGAESNE